MKATITRAALLCLIGIVQSPATWAIPVHATVPAIPATPAIPAIPGLPGDGAMRAVRAIPAVGVTPVPEVDTYAMMLAGLGLVGVMIGRRQVL